MTECDDPVVIVEVLSLLTRSGALIHKRWAYQAIPTLRHLLYVDAARLKVEVATRSEDGSWHSVFLEGPDAIVRLAALDASLRSPKFTREPASPDRAARGRTLDSRARPWHPRGRSRVWRNW